MFNEDDVVARNEELNQKLENRERASQFYNRPPLAYALLVFILAICIAILSITVVNAFNRNSRNSKTDSTQTHQTQLVCAAVINPMQYKVCRQVGLPQRIGDVK